MNLVRCVRAYLQYLQVTRRPISTKSADETFDTRLNYVNVHTASLRLKHSCYENIRNVFYLRGRIRTFQHIYQGKRSVGSKDRVETDGRTDRRTETIAIKRENTLKESFRG